MQFFRSSFFLFSSFDILFIEKSIYFLYKIRLFFLNNTHIFSNCGDNASILKYFLSIGDLAEAALIQGTERGSTTISIGAAGGWNSTQARRYHMLQSVINNEMTDPEIRGGLDGFILGLNIQTTLNVFSSLKLSQLLDMYYSPRVRINIFMNNTLINATKQQIHFLSFLEWSF